MDNLNTGLIQKFVSFFHTMLDWVNFGPHLKTRKILIKFSINFT